MQQAIKQNWSNLGSGKLPTGGEALQALKDLSTYMGPTKQAYELGALRSILAVFGRQERPDLYESDQQAWQKFRVTERYFRRSATALQNIKKGSSTTGQEHRIDHAGYYTSHNPLQEMLERAYPAIVTGLIPKPLADITSVLINASNVAVSTTVERN